MEVENKAKEQALRKVEESYNDPNSKFYRDNQRYKWAVNVINKRYEKPFDIKKCLR